MKLSTKGKYGLYAMYYLASQDGEGPKPLREIAEISVPEQYLEQLLGSLRRAGLVTTVRGAQGGYQLSRPPCQITVGDIIDATEGPLTISDCLSDTESCHKSGQCAARKVWASLSNSINALLNSITLQDMLDQNT